MAGDDDFSVTKSSTTQVEQSITSSTSPYSLFASDNPRALITYVMFTGDNYNEWSMELDNALRENRKLGFINGTIPKPSFTDPNFEFWSSVS